MTKKMQAEEVEIKLKPLELWYTAFDLVGEAPFIPGKPRAALADFMRAMSERGKGEPYPPKPAKLDPKDEAKGCLHLTGDKKHPFGIPSGAFHGCFVQAATEILHLPAENIRLFRVPSGVYPIICEDIEMCSKDIVFRGNKDKKEETRTHFPATVYRPHFNPPWYTRVTVIHKPDVVSLDLLASIVQHAGQFIGLGQGRPGRGCHEANGVFTIAGAKRLVKEG